MSTPEDVISIGPFDPPYDLGGSLALCLGLWKDPPALPPEDVLEGYQPVCLLGRAVAVVIVSDFTQPPAELPIAYREVIAATLIHRGPRLASLPLAMWLDARTPVELGHQHYSMPKHHDATLRLTLTRSELSLGGVPQMRARALGPIARAFAAPLSIAFGLGVRWFTRAVPVVGVADRPARQAQIALMPDGWGRPCTVSEARVDGRRVSSLWCQIYGFSRTRLGPPSLFRRKEPR